MLFLTIYQSRCPLFKLFYLSTEEPQWDRLQAEFRPRASRVHHRPRPVTQLSALRVRHREGPLVVARGRHRRARPHLVHERGRPLHRAVGALCAGVTVAVILDTAGKGGGHCGETASVEQRPRTWVYDRFICMLPGVNFLASRGNIMPCICFSIHLISH